MVWVSPRHVALALTTGLLCGVLSPRIGGTISPPYAAILGTGIFYPILVTVWRRLRDWVVDFGARCAKGDADGYGATRYGVRPTETSRQRCPHQKPVGHGSCYDH